MQSFKIELKDNKFIDDMTRDYARNDKTREVVCFVSEEANEGIENNPGFLVGAGTRRGKWCLNTNIQA